MSDNVQKEHYWRDFYSKNKAPKSPSDFAHYISENFIPKTSENVKLLEIGCGNGRDSIFFATKKIDVTSVDIAESPDVLKHSENGMLKFVKESMANLENASALKGKRFDVIYSRFSLHAIPECDEDKVLDYVLSHLKKDGVFCVEARSTEDTLFGVGTQVERDENAFITDHYRRFIDYKLFCKKLDDFGLETVESAKGQGFARFGTEDPVVIRIVAKLK